MLADFFVEVNSMWSNDGTFDTFTSKQPEHIRPAKVKLKGKHHVFVVLSINCK